MLPTFFVIGAPKCGTTSLYAYLRAHPEIHMSPIKEPAFFVEPDPTRPLMIRRVGERAAYERLFDSEARERGEATPIYSQHPYRPGVPERIHALVPNAKFLYLVGDPVARLISGYLQRVASGGERRPLATTLADAEDERNPHVAASRYATQLERYLEVFPAERMHVVDQDDLRLRRESTLAGVFEFLGVDPGFTSGAFDVEHNATASHRQLSSAYWALSASRAGALVRRIPSRIRAPAVALAQRVASDPLPPAELDDALTERLRAVLQPEVTRLRELTGQEFAGWTL